MMFGVHDLSSFHEGDIITIGQVCEDGTIREGQPLQHWRVGKFVQGGVQLHPCKPDGEPMWFRDASGEFFLRIDPQPVTATGKDEACH